MAPLAPTQYADLGDNFVVSCIWKHKKRPASIPHIWSDAPNGCDIFSTRWGSGFDEYPKRSDDMRPVVARIFVYLMVCLTAVAAVPKKRRHLRPKTNRK
ncbi:hypothetical protein [Desulforamulus profundi]|uniref:hypothetical protein n=1 Tax=Desulforamulus profundi TaxID=1383067 RepID=UPI001EE4FD5B|nr:hypothetical protein [Desulforamulus profundi]